MGLLVYKTARWLLRRFFWCWGGLEIRGREHVPPEGPLIVACNHASHFDPMILGATFDRPLHFMARRSLFRVPGFAWLIRNTQAFPLNREGDIREAMRVCGALLEKDAAVVMFPEGTRSLDGVVGEMKPGVGMLAVRNRTPILPVYIRGSFQSWPRGRSFPRPHGLLTLIGKPIPAIEADEARKEAQQRITDAVGEALRRLEREAWSDDEGTMLPGAPRKKRVGEDAIARRDRLPDGDGGGIQQA